MVTGDSTPRLEWPKAIGWGAYLVCSWTWCIGMFLPILFVRNYGIWGFVIFAVPNVVGAAAMGWFLRRPGASESLQRTHHGATVWFSRITIAFQIFFFVWLASGLLHIEDAGAALKWLAVAAIPVVAVLVMPCVATEKSSASRRVVGALMIWGVSILAAAIAIANTDRESWTIAAPTTNSMGAAFIAPVCAFGFLLCPYLDRTFHRARQSVPGPTGTAAFFIGFSVLFLAMVLFTLFYASGVLRAGSLAAYVTTGAAGAAVYVHLLTQLAYTIRVHEEELSLKRGSLVSVVAAGVLFVLFALVVDLDIIFRGRAIGEIMYLSFISCYSFIFPAYVYLIMIPTRDGHRGSQGESGRKKLRILFLAVGCAAPMMWMGFIEQMEIWAVPGLAVVLLSRLALPGRQSLNPV